MWNLRPDGQRPYRDPNKYVYWMTARWEACCGNPGCVEIIAEGERQAYVGYNDLPAAYCEKCGTAAEDRYNREMRNGS